MLIFYNIFILIKKKGFDCTLIANKRIVYIILRFFFRNLVASDICTFYVGFLVANRAVDRFTTFYDAL